MSVSLPYRLLDSGNFEKLESIGPYTIVRPAAGAVWSKHLNCADWQAARARFQRSVGGEGRWQYFGKRLPGSWQVKLADQMMGIKLTDFGHLGLFAEQASEWQRITRIVATLKGSFSNVKVLNLFAYTGGSTIAAAKGGAEVVHCDASKTSVAWARENALLNGLEGATVRWICDDASKFVARELRRGNTYDGIILDPPSFGRGPKGQAWKIEDHLTGLLGDLQGLLTQRQGCFVLLSAHSQGYTPIALRNLLSELPALKEASFEFSEMVIAPNEPGCPKLPSGAVCLAKLN